MRRAKTFAESAAQLKTCILPARRVLVATHDYPDPDCLSSALGVQRLLRHWGHAHTTIAYGGFVGRLENRALVDLAGIGAVTLSSLSLDTFDKTILVDAFPGRGNVSLPMGRRIDAVIDHHPVARANGLRCFNDIRPEIAATATIITHYLLAESCPIDSTLATALFYGIKTDTSQMRLKASAEDMLAYHLMFDRLDHERLARIEDPPRPVAYFRMVHDALESAVRYGAVGYAHLTHILTPDHVAEMTDFTLRLNDLEWMLCSGIVGNNLYFSVRSKQEEKAGPAAERIAFRMRGTGGGHAKRAAGRAPLDGRGAEEAVAEFVQSFRSVLRIGRKAPVSILRQDD